MDTFNINERLSEKEINIRREINSKICDISYKGIHEDFFEIADEFREKEALVWLNKGKLNSMTYGNLKKEALKSKELLKNSGVTKGDLVAIMLQRGTNQIVFILGILALGASYVPIGYDQPKGRVNNIIEIGEIKYLVTDSNKKQLFLDNNIKVIDDSEIFKITNYIEELESVNVNSTAYVIFTSGTTGMPKGVYISHKGAYNTIYVVNNKFNISSRDAVLALSEINFDLSVYDIFGLLSVGGTVCLLQEENKKEPSEWIDLIEKKKITIWNSAPALFEMLVNTYIHGKKTLSLKKVLLSGDWIGKELFNKMKNITDNCEMISLGGATECSIWSNYYRVESIKDHWKSIPYGYPLDNQRWMILDENGKVCPNYEVGELYIGGAGVAKGYLNNEELTRKSFLNIKGEVWYKTGDLAVHHEDGVIEFIGRKDSQIKKNGYRIELGEIENTLKINKNIDNAVVQLVGNNKNIVAVVLPKKENLLESNITYINNKISVLKDNSKESIEKVVEIFLTELLQNSKIHNNNKGLEKMWLDWLLKRNVIKFSDDNSFEYLLDKSKLITKKEAILQEEGKLLYENIELFKEILNQETESEVLLKHEKLNPEYFNMKSDEVRAPIYEIVKEIKESIKIYNSISMGIWEGRTGISLKTLIEILDRQDVDKSKVEITLLDNSLGFIEKAKERLKDKKYKINYYHVKDVDVFKSNEYKFDFIIGINTIHRNKNIKEVLDYISLLIKNNGKLLMIEYIKLHPIALVISAILEDGFKEGNPFRSKLQWGGEFKYTDYKNVKIQETDEGNVLYFSATVSEKRWTFNEESINKYLQKTLPNYMLPDKTYMINKMPYTVNGKIDRKKIVNLIQDKKVEILEELTETEEKIIGRLKELLNIKNISKENSFFEIGGDSLLATRLVTIIKEDFCISLSLKEIFEYPKICEVSSYLDKKVKERGELIEGEI